MTTPDYEQFQTAHVVFPLTTSLDNSLLQDADPVIFYALDFFSWIITNVVGGRLVAAAAAAGAPIASAVQQRYPTTPDFTKLENQFQFPLFCLSRTGTEYDKHSSSYYHDTCAFDLLYAFPPLTQGQAEQIVPIFRAIEIALRDRCVQGYDPNYTPPGGSAGQQPWGEVYAYVESIGFNGSKYGVMTNNGEEFFPTLIMSGFAVERQNYVPLPRVFTGVDLTETLVAADKTSFGPIVQVSTQVAPDITSINVSSGPFAGGTSVTITGTNFGGANYLEPMQILFGANEATSVVVVSGTEITCVTPAMSGTGTVDITVINLDGQQAVAPAAFTFD